MSQNLRSKFLAHETTLRDENRDIPRLPRRRQLQGVQNPVKPRAWVSWTQFVLDELQEPRSSQADAEEYVVEHMEHIGSIFGTPTAGTGSREMFDVAHGMNSNGLAPWMNPKGIVARKVINVCLERAKNEVWDRIKNRIEEDGVGVLQSILESDSVLDAVLGTEISGNTSAVREARES